MLETSLIAFFFFFGILLGTLFGFFAMGGSFLITPLLMILGFPTNQAVATGLSFVFGTAIISVLKHREYGQTDYKLGLILGGSMSIGVYFGSIILSYFESLGSSNQVVGLAYIVLLIATGLKMISASKKDSELGSDYETIIREHRIYPVISIGSKDRKVSIWILVALGFLVGLLAGFMGVGGGFLLVPVITLFLGLSPALGVGTAVLVVMLSSGYGTFIYAGQGLIDLKTVSLLLFGSALGAKLGAKASHVVSEDSLELYFGLMMIFGGVAIVVNQLYNYLQIQFLQTLSLTIIVGVTLLMSAIIYIDALKNWKK